MDKFFWERSEILKILFFWISVFRECNYEMDERKLLVEFMEMKKEGRKKRD